MQPGKRSRRPNEDWPGLVDQLLYGTEQERAAARAIMWSNVLSYVENGPRLPMGPLAEDVDVLRDVATRVMERLEKNGFKHVRRWRERQHKRADGAPWWGWIRKVTRNIAIDLARGSERNVARRREPFEWVKIAPVDPTALTGHLGGTVLQYATRCTRAELRAYLDQVQRVLRKHTAPATQPRLDKTTDPEGPKARSAGSAEPGPRDEFDDDEPTPIE